MRPVTVRIMHPEAGPSAGPLGRWLADERARIATRHADGFRAAGAADVAVVAGPPDATSFGERLRTLVRAERPAGLVVLGSGAIPLATARDRRDLVTAAGVDGRVALANNRYSADVVAVAGAWPALDDIPDLPSDNALPRWLAEVAGFDVRDLATAMAARARHRWTARHRADRRRERCGAGRTSGGSRRRSPASGRSRRNPTAELLVAGRTSSSTLAWLERTTASRTRALIEERGLRTGTAGQRPPASVLAALIERDGAESFGALLASFGDAAIVDTRVLMAARFGRDEAAWPAAEDRYASDLLLHEGIADPWLRALTASAAGAPIPVLLGGHTLVGPGLRLALRSGARGGSVDVTPGLRRDPAPDLDAVGEDVALVARIHAEIDRDGPITFARFMDLALYDPDGGYYRADAARPGRDGDFLTAPEAHPIFGAALARAVADAWDRLDRPVPFVLREYGAGTGALGAAILGGVHAERPDLAEVLRYQPIEAEATRLDALAARFEGAGLSPALDRDATPGRIDGVRPRQRGPRRAARRTG